VALAASLLSACGTAGGPDTLTLYSGQHPQTTADLVAGFEKETGMAVRVRYGDEAVLANQLATEGTSSPADVFLTENSPPLQYLAGKHLLVKVDPATLARVPAQFSSPDGDWVGVTARVSVMVYNTSLVKRSELPRSILGLAEPRWAGKLALAPSETDFQPLVTAVAADKGEAAALAWLTALKANATGHIYPDNETITSMVNAGRAAIGVINQYYWFRLRAEIGAPSMHSAIAFFAPGDPGYVLDVSGAAVLRSSTHEAAAQRFLAYLVSDQGQRIINGSDSFEYPLAPGIAPPADQVPLHQLHPYPITVAELGDGQRAVALLEQVQLL
jgi:iron(III) transport system substrate-binding protein